MKDSLAKLHKDTYDTVADEYEDRVELLRPTTELALANFTDLLPPNSKVLDVGCAVGYTVEILRLNNILVDGIDISPKMVAYAQQRNPLNSFVVGDFLETAYPERHYDGILMYAFLHLFPKDVALECLEKAVAITKPGGLIYTGTTKSSVASEGFEIKHDYKNEVKRYRKRWTQAEIESVFESRGLNIVDYAEKVDEIGKVWMDYIVSTPS